MTNTQQTRDYTTKAFLQWATDSVCNLIASFNEACKIEFSSGPTQFLCFPERRVQQLLHTEAEVRLSGSSSKY